MIELTPDEARSWLVSHHGLARPLGEGREGARALLRRARCIQLDPLDPIGTNADLVALARVDGLVRGEVYDAVLPGHAFEHFAKERCLLPAVAFPRYRDHAREAAWFRTTERMKRIDEGLLDDVEAEVRARGPVSPSDLADRGRVEPLDWSGWKGTGRASTLALEVLYVRCRVVVAGRAGNQKSYDVPERALPEVAAAEVDGDFATWALLDRVEAAGLLPRAAGPHWGQLHDVRTTLPDRLLAEGRVEEVRITGSRRTWLAPAAFREREVVEPDARMRILGPLDAVLWDRALVSLAFGFDYVWEVYKPAAERRWGWYVTPLLHRGRLVGRIEARFVDGRIRVDHVWAEEGRRLDRRALRSALERHEAALRG